MFTKLFAGSLLAVGLSLAGVYSSGDAAQDCCAKKLACCQPKSACCEADAKLGCCEKGMKCCVDKKGCCTAVQKCCTTGSACCEQSKICCGPAAKQSDRDGKSDESVTKKASCCTKSA